MNALQEAAYRRLAARYPNAAAYGREVLGNFVTPQQEEIALQLNEPPYRVLVPSANNVGKTFLAGTVINWFHDRYDPGIVLATSSSFDQVEKQMFKEVRRQRPFGLGLMPKAPDIFHHDLHFVHGFSTNKADSFHGHHDSHLLLLFDEATGINPEFADRGETMYQAREGHGWLAFYNPNDSTTWPYAAEQGGDWHVVRLSALDHPNIAAELRGEPPPVPAAVRLDRVEARILKECDFCGNTPEDETCFLWPPAEVQATLRPPVNPVVPWGWWKPLTALFEVQVLGRWPSRSQSSVWSEAEVKRCRWKPTVAASWMPQIGCDMARDGRDKICIAVRKGIALVHLEEYPSATRTPVIADRLRALCDLYVPKGMPPRAVPVLIDDTGGYGSGVVDYHEGYRFIGLKASSAANDPDLYPNVRSELWWSLKIAGEQKAFTMGGCAVGAELLPKLEAELKAARYVLDYKNRRVIAGKDELKKVLKRSPDYCEAVCHAWYPVAQ